ncbi:unnamed protein product [Cyclocybe aegerita]|uniref:Ribonuclease H1 N-terminal domain-containing protein n=1 Tax=Cyclocybe aegerita TaxID=1973307 RepID=A0A8S0W507_CYCAE|nr:unnamed protein product [Cyclocybe aegerita]
MTSQKPTLSAELTLTKLIEALELLGVTVVSPTEQMNREGVQSAAIASTPVGPPASAGTPAAPSAPGVDVACMIAQLQALGINIVSPSGAPVSSSNTYTAPTPTAATGAGTGIPMFSRNIRSPWANTAPAGAAAAGVSVATVVPMVAVPAIGDMVGKGKAPEAAPATGSSGCTPVKPGDEAAANGFVCTHCNTYNMLKSATHNWYAITAGREVGVYQGWHRVQPLISGVPHTSYRKYASQAAATEAFNEAMEAGLVIVIN